MISFRHERNDQHNSISSNRIMYFGFTKKKFSYVVLRFYSRTIVCIVFYLALGNIVEKIKNIYLYENTFQCARIYSKNVEFQKVSQQKNACCTLIQFLKKKKNSSENLTYVLHVESKAKEKSRILEFWVEQSFSIIYLMIFQSGARRRPAKL